MEKPKRLKPKPETLRELFLKSGNLCAFPNCTARMIDGQGVFIGQLCHIEAAEPGGGRFNPKMTNEGRRAAKNLMLMCYAHHQITNDVKKFPVAKLRKMKHGHERRFSDPDRAILEHLTDWTAADQPTPVKNLRRINKVLSWNQSDVELKGSIDEINEFVQRLQPVPIEVRRFTGQIAERMHRIRNTPAGRNRMLGTSILVSDVRAAFRVSDGYIKKRVGQLESYGLGGLYEINTNLGPQPAIRELIL